MHGSMGEYTFFKLQVNIGKVIIKEKRMNRGAGYGLEILSMNFEETAFPAIG